MGRSFYGAAMRMARAADRASRAAARAQQQHARAMEREYKRRLREGERLSKLAEKEAKLAYLAERQEEVQELNGELEERLAELRSLLLASPESALPLDFSAMRKKHQPERFDAVQLIGTPPTAPAREEFVTEVPRPGFLQRLFGAQAKYDAEVQAAAERDRVAFEAAHAAYTEELRTWKEREAHAHTEFEAAEARRKNEVEEHNTAIAQFEREYRSAAPEAVGEYFAFILNRSLLPDGFPEDFRLAFVPESKQLVVEHDLPTLDVIPAVEEFSYVKAKDEIREKPRKKGEIAELYRDVVASVSLRILNELFSADSARTVETVIFNGVVHTISPSTGEEISPCIVSVRTTRDEFSRIALQRVDPVTCLKGLGANVSKKAEELVPVRPVLEFNTVDRRFVEESDVMSTLDDRPNIMDLNPYEFESLVTNLFQGMGLEAKLTRSSRDGGVDTVAYDPRPVLGGKVVIQAKRYRNTVGVSAVRDLYGTMMNEGANKGILVTTAGFGPDAFAFAKDKPIELIDGSGLLYLLQQQGIQARIIMPA